MFASRAPETSSLKVLLLVSSLMLSMGVRAQTPNTWRSLGTYPEWPFPYNRHEHAAAVVEDNFYIIGGRGNKPVQRYTPATDAWMDMAEPPLEIHHMQLVAIGKDIYVVGAFTGGFPNETPIPDIYIFHTETNEWEKGPAIPANRRRGSAGVVVYDEKIYLLSGITNGHTSGWVTWVDRFDPATGQWTELADAPRARDHFHAALVGNKIILAGGRRSGQDGTFNATEGAVDIYDINSNTWDTFDDPLPTKRGGSSAVALGSHVVVIGGESGTQFEAHDEVEAININNGAWRSLASMQQGRHGMQAVVYQNEVWVIGGSIERGANEIGREDPNFMEAYLTDIETGIPNEISKFKELKIWPNPLQKGQILQIQPIGGNSVGELQVFDLSGKLQFRRELKDDFSLVNLPNLNPGLYLLKFEQGLNLGIAKLLIE